MRVNGSRVKNNDEMKNVIGAGAFFCNLKYLFSLSSKFVDELCKKSEAVVADSIVGDR